MERASPRPCSKPLVFAGFGLHVGGLWCPDPKLGHVTYRVAWGVGRGMKLGSCEAIIGSRGYQNALLVIREARREIRMRARGGWGGGGGGGAIKRRCRDVAGHQGFLWMPPRSLRESLLMGPP